MQNQLVVALALASTTAHAQTAGVVTNRKEALVFVSRGQCTVDLPSIDHLAIAAEPLASVRERFHVVPLRHPVMPDDV